MSFLYRENLPMTMKSCFYPLIGDKIFGWMGDFIDIISVLTTLFGVCTSLGLGTRQLNSGFNVFNSDIDPDDITIQVKFIQHFMGIQFFSLDTFGIPSTLKSLEIFREGYP